MKYFELLLLPAWRLKRQEILKRDNWKCTVCHRKQSILERTNDGVYNYLPENQRIYLQVHHKCYRLNLLPWEHQNSDLITLCEKCHKDYHEGYKVKIYDKLGQEVEMFENCKRCNGIGYLEEYKHVENGICFRCRGTKRIPKYLNQYFNTELACDLQSVSTDIKIINNEFDDFVEFISNEYDNQNFKEFLDRLELIITSLNLSVYDERVLIIKKHPWYTYSKAKLIVQIGLFPYLEYPIDNLSYYNIHAGFTQQKDTWIDRIKREFENAGDITNYKRNLGSRVIYSRDLKDKNEDIVYKASIDREFRNSLIEKMMNQ
jgi:hypothetical protein